MFSSLMRPLAMGQRDVSASQWVNIVTWEHEILSRSCILHARFRCIALIPGSFASQKPERRSLCPQSNPALSHSSLISHTRGLVTFNAGSNNNLSWSEVSG